MFSFGETPYPGVSNSDIYKHILAGHRLTRPSACPRDVYDILRECWEREPTERPAFNQLADALDELADSALADPNDIEGGGDVPLAPISAGATDETRTPGDAHSSHADNASSTGANDYVMSPPLDGPGAGRGSGLAHQHQHQPPHTQPQPKRLGIPTISVNMAETNVSSDCLVVDDQSDAGSCEAEAPGVATAQSRTHRRRPSNISEPGAPRAGHRRMSSASGASFASGALGAISGGVGGGEGVADGRRTAKRRLISQGTQTAAEESPYDNVDRI
eukprot:Opistho-2@42657